MRDNGFALAYTWSGSICEDFSPTHWVLVMVSGWLCACEELTSDAAIVSTSGEDHKRRTLDKKRNWTATSGNTPYNICALTVGNHTLYHQDKHQPAQLELTQLIPWNPTSDVHRWSTLITWRWSHRNNANTITNVIAVKQTLTTVQNKHCYKMKFKVSVKYRYSGILFTKH